MILHQPPVRRRLFELLDRIICEEMSFKQNCLRSGIQDIHLRKRHDQIMENLGCHKLERVEKAHRALFESHQKFLNDHELVIQRCLVISRQARAGLLNDGEMTMEVERLQSELKRVKQEHGQVEKECRQILHARKYNFGGPGSDN